MKSLLGLHPLRVVVFLLCSSTIIAQPNFNNLIPIPPLLDASNGDTINLEMKLLKIHQFNPADPSDTINNGNANQEGIETWCYNLAGDTTMTYLGPTLKWKTGKITNIRVSNLLPQATTTHWHGAEVPAYLDGGPHQPIASDTFWDVNFLNLDSASTMWYHPHFHNNTYPQVQLGLSGMIISEQESDMINPTLPRTYGIDDIPIIIGDQRLKYSASLGVMTIDTAKSKRPLNLVNGLTNPYVEVPAHLVRLRILNGSTRKGLQMAFSESYTDTLMSNMMDFTLVATDGGYTMKPDTMKTLLTGPGARAEIILDLTGMSVGDSLYLRNLKHLMPGSIVGSPNKTAGPGGGRDSTGGNAFLKIKIVASPDDFDPVNTFTPFTSEWDPGIADTLNITKRRLKNLTFLPADPNALPPRMENAFMIDSLTYNLTTINDTVCVGAKEIWTIHNLTHVAHPFHIHKIFFRILDIDSLGTMINLEERGLNGPKDDVLIRPNWKLRFLAKFDDYPSPIQADLTYMYHCHILTHEDAEGGGMMHQFSVTDELECAPVSVLEEKLAVNSLDLFPNPAGDQLFMRGYSEQESKTQVVDLQGRIVKEQRISAFSEVSNLDISGLAPGFYIVMWYSEGRRFTGKVLLH